MHPAAASVFLFFAFGGCLADVPASNYYCASKEPQNDVSTTSLAGLWFGVEKIYHGTDQNVITNRLLCPTVYIEAKQPETPYRYGSTYGEGYPYVSNTPSTADYDQQLRGQIEQQQEAERRRSRGGIDASRYYGVHRDNSWKNPNQPHSEYHRRLLREKKYLKVSWEDSFSNEDFLVYYNISSLGMWWISSDQSGYSNEPEHPVGSIQVLKAVGRELVLLVCQQEKRLQYTLILSRDIHLRNVEIEGVHRLLKIRGLNTDYVQKFCKNGSVGRKSKLGLSVLLLLIFLKFYL